MIWLRTILPFLGGGLAASIGVHVAMQLFYKKLTKDAHGQELAARALTEAHELLFWQKIFVILLVVATLPAFFLQVLVFTIWSAPVTAWNGCRAEYVMVLRAFAGETRPQLHGSAGHPIGRPVSKMAPEPAPSPLVHMSSLTDCVLDRLEEAFHRGAHGPYIIVRHKRISNGGTSSIEGGRADLGWEAFIQDEEHDCYAMGEGMSLEDVVTSLKTTPWAQSQTVDARAERRDKGERS